MRAAAWCALLAVVALGLGCTKTNPRYCGGGGYIDKDCAKPADGGLDRHDATADEGQTADATDVAEASADVAVDVADTAEAGPICSSDPECAAMGDGGAPACETRDGGARCVQCTKNTHCGSAKPICDTTSDTCVQCNGVDPTMECKDSSMSACDVQHHVCVQCVDNTKCGGTTPICDLSTNTCRPCSADSECKAAPGICVDFDGHCAVPADVITLQSNAGCTASAADFSFCKSADAVGGLAASPARSVLIVKGPAPVAALDVTGSVVAPKVLIVGQGGATIGAGSGDPAGVHVNLANKAVWVRDLSIGGGTTGVIAEASSELHLTRLVITHNDKGGVRTTSASFDITNSIIAANGVGSDTGGVTFGGARLGDIPASGVAHFENNTVVGNAGPGVSCFGAYQILNSIVHGNTTAQTAGCAATTPCCGASDPDPLLDATYHLMSNSPCIGQIPATMSTLTVDIDRQPRPTPPNGKLDCGADEFVAP
jgi:hypothetical protein